MIAGTKRVKFNSGGLVCTPVQIQNFQLPLVNWKYASLKYVMGQDTTCDTIREIVSQCPLQHKHKRVLIDVKVQRLTPSVTSCLPGWHLDGPGNPLHLSKSELHHLYIHDEGGETEFIDEEFELDVRPDMSQKEIVDLIPNTVKITTTKAKNFVTFTRFDFHRGINVKTPLTRLLVRLTETDLIVPSNKPYKHAVGTII